MSEKLLSVLISIYNDEKYLGETLDSVFNAVSEENRKLVEFIFINDGSTDKTYNILEDYHQKYNFTVIHQDNCGLAKSQKTLLGLAGGKYVYNMGHDDLLEPHAIDIMLNYIQENPTKDLVLFDYASFSVNLLQAEKHKGGCPFKNNDGQNIFVELYEKDLCVIPEWNKIVSRKILVENNIFSGNPFVIDIETTPIIYSLVKNVGYIPEVLYTYRIHSDSMGRSPELKRYSFTKNRLHAIESLKKLIDERSDLTDKFVCCLYDMMSNLYMSAISGIKYQGQFNEELVSELGQYTWLLQYGKWDRRYIFSWVVKNFGIKGFYRLRFKED